MKKFLDEFKAFALKGNMIDLAVGMIIGSPFTSIVNFYAPSEPDHRQGGFHQHVYRVGWEYICHAG